MNRSRQSLQAGRGLGTVKFRRSADADTQANSTLLPQRTLRKFGAVLATVTFISLFSMLVDDTADVKRRHFSGV